MPPTNQTINSEGTKKDGNGSNSCEAITMPHNENQRNNHSMLNFETQTAVPNKTWESKHLNHDCGWVHTSVILPDATQNIGWVFKMVASVPVAHTLDDLKNLNVLLL